MQRAILHRYRILVTVSVFKISNFKCQFTSKYKGYCANLFFGIQTRKAKEWALNVKKEQSISIAQRKLQETASRASFSVAYNITKHNKSFSDSEFVKQCMMAVAETVYPENKTAFENINLSRRATVHSMEKANSDLLTQLNDNSSNIHILFCCIG
jgi:uncharacterized protein YdaT